MKILCLGGSLRAASLNRKLLGHISTLLEGLGHSVLRVEGESLRIPLYDADLAPPEGAKALHEGLASAQALVLVSPEYNAGIPPHLKNAVDWVSTMKPSPWANLPVLLCSASPGAFGGSRAMLPWRATLANLGAMPLPGSVSIPNADKNLGDDGAPTDPRSLASLKTAVDALLELALKLGTHAPTIPE